MNSYHVFVQKGQSSEPRQQELVDGLKALSAESFGDDPSATPVRWYVIPEGFAWTGGKPSTSSLIRCDVPEMPSDTRTEFMDKISDLWVEQTGCDRTDVVITV